MADYKELKETVNLQQDETILELGNNIFIYNVKDTVLTDEDKRILEESFREEEGKQLYVYREDGVGLVCY